MMSICVRQRIGECIPSSDTRDSVDICIGKSGSLCGAATVCSVGFKGATRQALTNASGGDSAEKDRSVRAEPQEALSGMRHSDAERGNSGWRDRRGEAVAIGEKATVCPRWPAVGRTMNATQRNQTRGIGSRNGSWEQLDDYLAQQGLHHYHIPADGNSLFRAVAEQLFDCQARHVHLRRRCVAELRCRPHLLRRVLAPGAVDVTDPDKNPTKDFLAMVDRYCERMSADGEPGGEAEMCAMSLVFGVDFVVFAEPHQEPRNVTGNGFSEKVVLCVGAPHARPGHFDLVYSNSRLEALAETQSLVYDLLYKGVFDLGDKEVDFAVHEMVFNKDRFHNQGTSRATFEQWCEAVLEGEVPDVKDLPPDENSRMVLAINNGVPPFPFKVAKCLETSVYRNVEYLTWCAEQREIRRQGSLWTPPLAAGVECLVCQEDSLRSRPAIVEDLDEKAGFAKVYVYSLRALITVPLERVKVVPIKTAHITEQQTPYGFQMRRLRKFRLNKKYSARLSETSFRFNCIREGVAITSSGGPKGLPSPAGAHFWSSASKNSKSIKIARSQGVDAGNSWAQLQRSHQPLLNASSVKPPAWNDSALASVADLCANPITTTASLAHVGQNSGALVHGLDNVTNNFQEGSTLPCAGNPAPMHSPLYLMHPYSTAIAIPSAQEGNGHIPDPSLTRSGPFNGVSVPSFYEAPNANSTPVRVLQEWPAIAGPGTNSTDSYERNMTSTIGPVPFLSGNIYQQSVTSGPISYGLAHRQKIPASPSVTALSLLPLTSTDAYPLITPVTPLPLTTDAATETVALELACGLRFAGPPPQVDTQLAYRCERNGILPTEHPETLNYFFSLGMKVYKHTMPSPTMLSQPCAVNNHQTSLESTLQGNSFVTGTPLHPNSYVQLFSGDLSLLSSPLICSESHPIVNVVTAEQTAPGLDFDAQSPQTHPKHLIQRKIRCL
ncbi:hypothetical protein BIW11_12647 [Tropilaelaps mercedesae]|uniref:OTU domain-containing protein n=1 Tax=Tropilaelaps mercedesae TaxID=418985 RepID=A0A1V9X5S0_9ACAR|nr:hypothetical protein BIW11_12647 [Tropilaelaps mercedesae]